jgi:hypothetical protein
MLRKLIDDVVGIADPASLDRRVASPHARATGDFVVRRAIGFAARSPISPLQTA